MKKFTTSSALETQQIAQNLAHKYKNGGILALSGPLGSGKTTFAQGFAQGLGVKEHLISPTFILMRSYKIPNNQKGRLYHIDLYRLNKVKGFAEVEELGLPEIFANPQNIILIEWAEKLGNLLPQKTTKIIFHPISENNREIKVVGTDVA